MNTQLNQLCILYGKALQQELNNLLDTFQFLSKEEIEHYKSMNIGIIAANLYPDAQFERLQTISRLLLWMLLCKDVYSFYSSKQLKPIHQCYLLAFEGKPNAACDDELCMLIQTLGAEVRKFASTSCWYRFIFHFNDYLKGIRWMTDIKQSTVCPVFSKYIVQCEQYSFTHMLIDFMEIAIGAPLSTNILHSSLYQRHINISNRALMISMELQPRDQFPGSLRWNFEDCLSKKQQLSYQVAFHDLENLRTKLLEENLRQQEELQGVFRREKLLDEYLLTVQQMIYSLSPDWNNNIDIS